VERVSSATTVVSTAPSAALDKSFYKHYVLLVLLIGYVFNVADRGVYGVVLESIKTEIRASDFLMGLIGGLAFSICHSVATIPIARLADRWSRVKVLSIAVGVWSLATASCGLAWSYLSLFFGRALTAIGEAGGTPPSHALIADYFPPRSPIVFCAGVGDATLSQCFIRSQRHLQENFSLVEVNGIQGAPGWFYGRIPFRIHKAVVSGMIVPKFCHL
jgi:hypothetical protein